MQWRLFYFDDEGCPEQLFQGTLDACLEKARGWMEDHVGLGSTLTSTVIDDLSRIGARYAELPHGALVIVTVDV